MADRVAQSHPCQSNGSGKAVKLLLKITAAVLALIVVLVVTGFLILRTDWFREKLRERAVAEVEKATGGRAEIGSIRFDPKLWYARLDQFTIHGTEGLAAKPLFHAEAIEVNLKIVSYLKRTIDVAGLRIVAPEIHIV